VPFIEQLWEGLNVKIIYSSKPLVEKNRVLYLRAGSEKANRMIRERLVPIGTEVTESHRQYTHRALLDALGAAVPLQLCWGRRGVMGSVSFSNEKCLDLDTIKHIKVSAWSLQCAISVPAVVHGLVPFTFLSIRNLLVKRSCLRVIYDTLL
jgi:hypothetical protein